MRELIFGVLALQQGHLSLRQLTGAISARGEVPLGEWLVQQGLLDAQQRAQVEEQVDAALRANSGDPQATLEHMHTDERILVETLTGAVLHDEDEAGPAHAALAPVFGEPVGRYDWQQSSELGRGGAGRVVRVFDTTMGREVAVKQLLVNTDSVRGRMALEARFLREARLTGQLEHPAVLPVYEVGRQDDGGLYYAMQRVRGRTLHEALHAEGELAARLKLMPHFFALCQAMAYAHSRGVIHRDVKPHNVMIGEYGETYLLDWGLARVKGQTDLHARERVMAPDLTGNALEGRAIGTPSYMSPEQAAGRLADIDEQSDVFGLGGVLYELLTRKTPHQGTVPVATLAAAMHEPVRPVSQVQRDVPRELAAIAMKCLAREKAARYPNAQAVAEDVGAWLQGKRVAAHRYGPFQLVALFVNQNRLASLVASVALVVLAAFAVVSVQRIKRERDAAKDLAQLFLDDVSVKLEPLPGARPLLEQLTTQTLQHYQQIVDPLSGPADERLRLGWAWQRIGRLTYQVGKGPDSKRAFGFAQTVAEGLGRESGGGPLLAEAIIGLGDVTCDEGDVTACEQLYRRAARLSEQAVGEQADSRLGLEAQSRAYSRLAGLLDRLGRSDDGLAQLQKSIAVDAQMSALWPDDRQLSRNRGIGAVQLAQLYSTRGDITRARVAFEQARDIGREAHAREPGDAEMSSIYAYGMGELGRIDRWQGRDDHGAVREAAELISKLLEDDPDNVEYLADAIELRVELDDDALAWQYASRMFAQSTQPENLPSALLGAFASGHHREVLEQSKRAVGTASFSGAVFGAMSAALVGDREAAARLAADARGNVMKKSGLPWGWRKTVSGIAGHVGPLADAARTLCGEIDEAYWTRDSAKLEAALGRFEHAMAP